MEETKIPRLILWFNLKAASKLAVREPKEMTEFEKRVRLNTSNGAAEAHVDDANVARNLKETDSKFIFK